MSYKIGVIGTGYVGLVSGTSFAATGNQVICVDIDEAKVAKMRKGISPIYEPGLEHLLIKNINDDRLHFTTNLEQAVIESEIIFLCLPTPPNEDGSADLMYVLNVAKDIAEIYKRNNHTAGKIIVNKSTVPVGTADKVKAIFDGILPGNDYINILSNPEFLREGFAVEDALKPERVVIGTDSEYAANIMKDLYAPFLRSGNPIYIMDIKSAEVTKYAANSFLATKISFMNDLSRYCDEVGADIEKIRMGIGSDTRIGKRFLFSGIGYGGSCFPKDVKALAYSAESAGTPLAIIEAAKKVNHSQIDYFVSKIMKRYNNDVSDKEFALWGLAFKPDTDDVREAPAYRLIDILLEKGAKVTAYDPEAMENTKELYGSKINYADNTYKCLENCDALIIATEWNVFRNPDFDKIKSLLKSNIIFDGRNLFEPKDMKQLGFDYFCVGRGY